MGMTFTPRISPYDCIVFCNANTVQFAENDNKPKPPPVFPVIVYGWQCWFEWMCPLMLWQTKATNINTKLHSVRGGK